jgi:hypothetical protein
MTVRSALSTFVQSKAMYLRPAMDLSACPSAFEMVFSGMSRLSAMVAHE